MPSPDSLEPISLANGHNQEELGTLRPGSLESLESADEPSIVAAAPAAHPATPPEAAPAPQADRSTQDTPQRPPAVATVRVLPRVPGYEILEELGNGAMGIVYLARQQRLNRRVALKMVLPEHTDPEILRRMLAEAEAIAQLTHPNFVQVYEVGEFEGRPFFSMEYVQGGSLKDRLKGVPWSADRRGPLAPLVEKLARAVQAVHELGIIHRDLKPANVLMDAQANPKVTDFGLAKRVTDTSGRTATGMVLGTPCYMPPEQARGNLKEVGPAADVYALGAILYELLTGRPPFRGADIWDTLYQVVNQEPVPPSRLAPRIPRDLETICLKCLRKEPARRYASAGDLADDLRRFIEDRPIRAKPASRRERTWRWCRRNPGLAAACAMTLMALVATAVLGFRAAAVARHVADLAKAGAQKDRVAAQLAEKEKVTAQAAAEAKRREAESKEELNRQTRDRLFQSLIGQARGERPTNPKEALEHLKEAARISSSPELREEAILTLTQPRMIPIPGGQISFHEVAQGSVAVSPDARFILVGGILESDGSEEARRPTVDVRRLPDAAFWRPPRRGCSFRGWTADSRRVLLNVGPGRVSLWDIESDRDLGSVDGVDAQTQFSPDGTWASVRSGPLPAAYHLLTRARHVCPAATTVVRFLSNDELLLEDAGHRFWRWRFAAGSGTLVPAETPLPGGGVPAGDGRVPSRDGRLAAFVVPEDPNTVCIRDTTTSRIVARLTGGNVHGRLMIPEAPTPGSFSADGAFFAEVGDEGEALVLRVWDVESGTLLARLPWVGEAYWAGESNRLITVGIGERTRASERWVEDAEHRRLRYSTRDVHLWEIQRPTPALVQGNREIQAVSWTRDGSRLVVNEDVWAVARVEGRLSIRRTTTAGPSFKHVVCAGNQIWGFGPLAGELADGSDRLGPSSFVVTRLSPDRKQYTIPLTAVLRAGWFPRSPGEQPGTPFLRVSRLAFHADGNYLLLALQQGWRQGGADTVLPGKQALALWDLLREQPFRMSYPDEAPPFDALQFSPDGKQAVTSDRIGVHIWNLPDLRGRILQERSVDDGCFSVDGGRFLAREMQRDMEGSVTLVDVRTGRSLQTWRAPRESWNGSALSPDGGWVVSGGSDGRVRFWDALTGRELVHWKAHESTVSAVAFSADGRTLVTGAHDGTFKLWDIEFIRQELGKLNLNW